MKDDTVYGGATGDVDRKAATGNDAWLGGDAGTDYIVGGVGNDRIDGGADGDTWLGWRTQERTTLPVLLEMTRI